LDRLKKITAETKTLGFGLEIDGLKLLKEHLITSTQANSTILISKVNNAKCFTQDQQDMESILT
jgi:hypothetical protein